MRTVTSSVLFVLGSLLCVAAAAPDRTSLEESFTRYVAPDGSLRLPVAVARRELVHLGSWFVPEGDAAGFHHVRTQAEAAKAYRETGAFPDGTVLVKEIVSHGRGDYTTGANVAFARETRQWFLMVKDTKGRFAGHPLWGQGWGWALFQGANAERQIASDHRKDCLGCHAPAQTTDWVYVEGYPALREEGSP